MIADLKPYPAMKDSGVPWLGDVPEHWKVRRGKALFRCIDVRSPAGEEELLTVSSDRGVVRRSSTKVTMFKAESYAGYKLCWPGDLVINSLWAWGRGLGVARHHGIVSSAYGVYRLRRQYEGYSGYIHELVRSTPFNWELQVRSKGIWISRLQLTDEAFLGAPFPLPPSDEQAAIVRFLDHADRRIRRYIRAKQKLIKLLEEQKQAIIHRAVTRGLDPNVRLKPLGSAPGFEVNVYWRTARMGEISLLRSEKNRADLDLLSVFLGRGVIPYGEGGGQVHKPSLDLAGYQVVNPGDLVLNNQQAWRGSVGVSKYHGIISPAYVVMSLADSLDSPFANYLFQSRVMVSQFVTSSKGVGDIQRDINISWLRNVRVPIPRVEEQQSIARRLDQELTHIARELSLSERQISLLREYRTRLIADVVTGKLDVREAAARLPDEPEQSAEFGEEEDTTDVDGERAEDEADVEPAEA